MSSPDPFDLSRFIDAQDPVFEDVLAELRGGRKRSHWMWFIFPQIDGLGFSSATRYYSIHEQGGGTCLSLASRARAASLTECAEILLSSARPLSGGGLRLGG